MRKPKPFKLINSGNTKYDLVACHRGHKVFYLTPDHEHFIWIDGPGKLKRLIKWLQKLERYQQ